MLSQLPATPVTSISRVAVSLPPNVHLSYTPRAAMSVDIDYSLLSNEALVSSLLVALNSTLAKAKRPSFLGPISLTSFDFGTEEPDVEILGIRDVYRDFVEAEEDHEEDEDYSGVGGGSESGEEAASSSAFHPMPGRSGGTMDDPRHRRGEWGRSASPRPWSSERDDGEDERRSLSLQGYYRPSASSAASFTGALPPGFPSRAAFGSPLYHASPLSSRVGLGSAFHSPLPTPHLSRHPSFDSTPPRAHSSSSLHHYPRASPDVGGGGGGEGGWEGNGSSSSPPTSSLPSSSSGPPSLQLHLQVHHPSNIRLTLTTTLLINHPSPAFMTLPLTLTVTRLELDFHLVVAFQSAAETASPSRPSTGSRVHLSILDEFDPYGPVLPRGASNSTRVRGWDGEGKPPPIGQRIIPNLEIESSIGTDGEHVLRNVAKVERFVLDLLRETIVNELVYPNFHSICLGGS